MEFGAAYIGSGKGLMWKLLQNLAHSFLTRVGGWGVTYSFFFWSFLISCGVMFVLELSDFLWRGENTPKFFSPAAGCKNTLFFACGDGRFAPQISCERPNFLWKKVTQITEKKQLYPPGTPHYFQLEECALISKKMPGGTLL